MTTNRPPVRAATSPARPHRMLRAGGAIVELAAAVLGAGVAVAAGAHPGVALATAMGAAVVLGVACTLAAGATPTRAAIGYRVEGLDGGRPPLAGVVLREVVRPLGAVAVVNTVGWAGLLIGPSGERWQRRLTRTVVVGRPRRSGAALVAAAGAAVAVASLIGAVVAWGGSRAEDALLAWAAFAAAFGAYLVAMAREEVRWLDLVGELVPAEEATAADDLELWPVADRPRPERGAEVRAQPGDAGPGRPDVVVSPRGTIATHKRRSTAGTERAERG